MVQLLRLHAFTAGDTGQKATIRGYFPRVNGSSPGPAAFVAKERDVPTTEPVA